VGTGICQLTVEATVTATFNLAPPPGTFNLVVAKVGTGSGTVISDPPGIDCGTTCSNTFQNGTTVTLTAASSSGSTFIGWSGGGCVGTGTCLVDTAATLTATFDAPVLLSSNSNGEGGCTIGQAGKFDALMPSILLVTLGALIWRLRNRSH
jgi:hypothetical protein